MATRATTMTATGSPALPEQINALYAIPEPTMVGQFLSSRAELARSLVTVAEKAAEYFPQSSERRLRIVPPYEDEPESLLVQIVTSLSAQEAFDQLRRLDREWWLEASAMPELSDLIIDVLPITRGV